MSKKLLQLVLLKKFKRKYISCHVVEIVWVGGDVLADAALHDLLHNRSVKGRDPQITEVLESLELEG